MRVTRAKRALIGTVTGAMVLGLMPAGAALADIPFDEVCEGADRADFPDRGTTHAEAIDCMTSYGVIQGFADGTFGTGQNISRQAFASLVVRFAETAAVDIELDKESSPFTDVTSSTHRPNVNALFNAGIIDGTSETTFSPNASLTRGQAATILRNAHVALGVDFGEDNTSPFTDLGATHGDAVNDLYAAEILLGRTATTYGYSLPIQRGQIASALARSAQVLLDLGLWDSTLVEAPTGNQTFTVNPELESVTRNGDIVTFKFDQNIPGKSLDFFNTEGDAGSLAAGDEVDYYTGLRLYDAAGTAYYPQEAGIFGNEIRARFVGADTVAAAVRAGVYEGTVQNAVGRSNPASDFPLAASAGPGETIDPYFPQLSFVGNLRDTDVTPAQILVDYRFTFEDAATATGVLGVVSTFLGGDNNSEALADEFAIVGSAGQVFRGEDIAGATRSGANITVAVVMDPAIQDVPVSQLRRGFVEEDAFLAAGLPHILLSEAYGNISEVNGTTTDPDLRAVERGTGVTMRFIFDEGVSVPSTDLLQNPELYTVVDENDNRATPTSIGRSLIAADGATVMVATFAVDDVPGDSVPDYLSTVVAASVDTNWLEAFVVADETFAGTRTRVASSAARGTNQVGSQQLGWSLPAQVAVTPVQPVVPSDPTPGVTALPDLVSVEKSQNSVTGNWSVTYTFDQMGASGTPNVDFSLYDAEGVRFSSNSRDIPWSAGTNVGGQRVFTFGPNVSTSAPIFSNEQIAASVLGTVQDSDAELDSTVPPRVTEGHDGIR